LRQIFVEFLKSVVNSGCPHNRIDWAAQRKLTTRSTIATRRGEEDIPKVYKKPT